MRRAREQGIVPAQRDVVDRGHLTRDPEHTETVRPVGRNLEVDHRIVRAIRCGGLRLDAGQLEAGQMQRGGDLGYGDRRFDQVAQPGDEHSHCGNCSRKRMSFS